jgi:predicted negative regulator of RcsB-dependent stress response
MSHGFRNRPARRDPEWRDFDSRRNMLRANKIAMTLLVLGMGAVAGFEYWQAWQAMWRPILQAIGGVH